MSINEIVFTLFFASLLVSYPPILYAENQFGSTIRTWIPDRGERNRFILNGLSTTSLMTILATISIFIEASRSISGVIFLGTVVSLGVTLAVAEADEHNISRLLFYGIYTFVFFITGVSLLNSYSFDFNIHTPWVVIAVFSSLVLGIIVSRLMTETDPYKLAESKKALMAFIALWAIGFGIYMMTVNLVVGLLIVGVIVVVAGFVQLATKDFYAILVIIMGIALIAMSVVGFIINSI